MRTGICDFSPSPPHIASSTLPFSHVRPSSTTKQPTNQRGSAIHRSGSRVQYKFGVFQLLHLPRRRPAHHWFQPLHRNVQQVQKLVVVGRQRQSYWGYHRIQSTASPHHALIGDQPLILWILHHYYWASSAIRCGSSPTSLLCGETELESESPLFCRSEGCHSQQLLQ